MGPLRLYHKLKAFGFNKKKKYLQYFAEELKYFNTNKIIEEVGKCALLMWRTGENLKGFLQSCVHETAYESLLKHIWTIYHSWTWYYEGY